MYDDRPQRRRRPWLITGAVVAAVVLIGLGVLVGVLAKDPDTQAGDNPRTTPSAEPSPTTSSDSNSKCGLPNGSQEIPVTAPKASWTLTNRTAVPSSPTIGPKLHTGNVASCFAHSPTGALFMVVNYAGDATRPDIKTSDLLERVYNDANKSKVIASTKKDRPGKASALQVVGYRFADASADRATIDIALRQTEGPQSGSYVSLTLTAGWQEGDWRLVWPEQGSPPVSALNGISGFTKWGGA